MTTGISGSSVSIKLNNYKSDKWGREVVKN
jgi:hypothetical protein